MWPAHVLQRHDKSLSKISIDDRVLMTIYIHSFLVQLWYTMLCCYQSLLLLVRQLLYMYYVEYNNINTLQFSSPGGISWVH